MGFDKQEDVDFSQMIFDKNEKLDESNDEDAVEKLLEFNPRANWSFIILYLILFKNLWYNILTNYDQNSLIRKLKSL